MRIPIGNPRVSVRPGGCPDTRVWLVEIHQTVWDEDEPEGEEEYEVLLRVRGVKDRDNADMLADEWKLSL